MMPKYVNISKVHIPKGFFEGLNVPKLLSWLESLPTADVEEVRHGEWEDYGNFYAYFRCSKCGYISPHFRYCPYCGAKMDGKEK